MINFTNIGSIIADVLVVCAFIISIFQAYKKGLTTMVFNLACLGITIIAVLLLYKPVTNFVYEHTGIDEFFAHHIENSISEFLDEQLEDKSSIDTSKTSISETVAKKINGYVNEAKEKSIDNVAGFVAEKLSYIVISALVVIVLCIVIRLSTIILRGVLYFLSHLPIIESFDKLGGALYGLLRGYIIIYFVLAVISLASPLLANTGLTACIKASKICSIFYNNNVFLKIIG